MSSELAMQSAGALSGDVYKQRLAQLLVIYPGACADAECPLTEQQEVLLNEIARLTTPPRIFGWQPSTRPHDPEAGR